MSFFSGLAMILLGSISLFFKEPQELANTEEIKAERALSRKKIRRFWVPLSLLFAYIVLLEPLGFLLATFLFLFSLFKLKDKRWLPPLIFSAVVVLVSYLFFSVWLKAQFPKGIFHIGG
jgi:putative tricarboxylic transport membrane protein